MNEGTFELGVPGNYTAKNVAEIEDFDKDEYGNIWYNVVFQGDAETYMWLAKNVPEEGKQYYGHLEKTKSGKRIRFKTDKLPEGVKPTAGSTSPSKTLDYEPSTNARWAIGMAYRAYIQVTGSIDSASGDFPFEEVEKHAKELVSMFERVKDGKTSIDSMIKSDVQPTSGRQKFAEAGEKLKNKISDEPPLNDDDYTG